MAEHDLPAKAGGEASADDIARAAESADEPSLNPAEAGADALTQTMAQARESGLPAANPTRWRRIEALAQRSARHTGATRQLLDARLHALLAELAAAAPALGTPGNAAPADAPPPQATTAEANAAAEPAARPLRALLAQLQGAASEAIPHQPAPGTDATPPAVARGAPRDLKVVQEHRAAWTQLRAEQRVAEAQTALPDQAGPLNSQLLLHRALALMRETAPGYLRHFMAQAEALMWLEQALEPPAAPPKATPRGKPNKTPSRGPRDGKSPR